MTPPKNIKCPLSSLFYHHVATALSPHHRVTAVTTALTLVTTLPVAAATAVLAPAITVLLPQSPLFWHHCSHCPDFRRQCPGTTDITVWSPLCSAPSPLSPLASLFLSCHGSVATAVLARCHYLPVVSHCHPVQSPPPSCFPVTAVTTVLAPLSPLLATVAIFRSRCLCPAKSSLSYHC